MSTLLNWTGAIEFQSEAHPWLAIQKAWAQALTGNLDRVEPTLQVPEQLLSPLEPTVEVRTMQGTIAAARAHCANLQGNTRRAAEYAQEALRQLPDCSSISQSIRSVATSILGDTSWINGNLDEALHAYTEAVRIGREANNLHMVIIANSNLADILMEQGQLHRASMIHTNSLQMAIRPDGQRSPLAGKIYAGLARFDQLRDVFNQEVEKFLSNSYPAARDQAEFRMGSPVQAGGLPLCRSAAAQVLRRPGGYDVVNTEGGHVGFAPSDEVEDAILSRLRQRFPHISAERIVSGPGLIHIYEGLAALEGQPAQIGDDKALWASALAGRDSLAAAALERFCLCLGAYAGDIALAQGAAGVVIAGGLGQRIADVLARSGFGQRFAAKGRFTSMMAAIPVKLINHKQPGLYGAAAAMIALWSNGRWSIPESSSSNTGSK